MSGRTATLVTWAGAACLLAALAPSTGVRAAGPSTPTAPAPSAPSGPSAPKTARRATTKRPRRRRSKLPRLHKLLSRRWMFLAPVEGRVWAGGFRGWGLLPGEGASLGLEVAAAPAVRWRRGRFYAALDLAAGHRETLGLTVRQTDLSGGLVVRGRPASGWELTGRLRARRRWRLGWPDLYQPVVSNDGARTGALRPTDRRGRASLAARGALSWAPSKAAGVVFDGGWDERVYDQDPAFDPVLRPMHLTPPDARRLWGRLAVKTRLLDGRLRLRARLGFEDKAYRYVFARDRRTGLTHASPGGAPANPLQHLTRWRADARASVWWRALRLRFVVTPRFVHQRDAFQGYYTWDSVGVGTTLRWRVARRWRFAVAYDLDLRGYTHDGYQPGGAHRPLDGSTNPDGSVDGDAVRTRARHRLDLEMSWRAPRGDWEPYLAGRWTRLGTNFPDYVPGVNPPGMPYSIDFDATWWRAEAGLRVRL